MNKQEVLDLIEEIGDEDNYEYLRYPGFGHIHGEYKINCEEKHGGRKGAGEEYWFVFSVQKGDGEKTFWKVPGWYASYEGCHFDVEDLFKVKEVEVKVTEWQAVE